MKNKSIVKQRERFDKELDEIESKLLEQHRLKEKKLFKPVSIKDSMVRSGTLRPDEDD